MRKYSVVCDCCKKEVEVPKPFITGKIPPLSNEGIYEITESFPEGWLRLIAGENEFVFCSVRCVYDYARSES